MPESKGDVYVRGCPRGLRDQFKSACAINGTNMNRELQKFMRLFIEESRRIHIGNDNELDKTTRIVRKLFKKKDRV